MANSNSDGDCERTKEKEAIKVEDVEIDEYDEDTSLLQLHPSHPLFLHPNDHPGSIKDSPESHIAECNRSSGCRSNVATGKIQNV